MVDNTPSDISERIGLRDLTLLSRVFERPYARSFGKGRRVFNFLQPFHPHTGGFCCIPMPSLLVHNASPVALLLSHAEKRGPLVLRKACGCCSLEGP